MDKKVIIIGHGVWGRALESVLRQNTNHVYFWNRQDPIHDADMLVLALPTQAMRDALTKAQVNEQVKIVINGSKGIERVTYKLPQEIVADVVHNDIDYYSLIGPSYAQEVMHQMPTLVNIGYDKGEQKELVQNIFQTDYFRVRLTNNVRALELSGALKNVYAIACGLAEGMGFGMNTRAKLIILAIEETQALFKSLDLPITTDMLAGTIGDLFLTCSSITSRNFLFGKILAEYPAEQALEKVGATVEGYFTASSIGYFQEQGITLPLASFVRQITVNQVQRPGKELFYEFLKAV